MLQYEQEQTQFVIRIERGRNLPPKDLPSQTSDPYVEVSTIPDWNNEGSQKSSTVNGNARIQLHRSNHQFLFNSRVFFFFCFLYRNGLGLGLLESICRQLSLAQLAITFTCFILPGV